MRRKRKYTTEEERKQAQAAKMKQWYQDHKEERAAKMKQYYTEHKEEIAAKGKEYRAGNKAEIAAYMKQYSAEHKDETTTYKKQWYQENKKKVLEQQKQYRAEHKEERATYFKQYYQEHKEEHAEYRKQYSAVYRSTHFGRAVHLASRYRASDKKHNRGECTVTPEWIVDNIFSGQCCVYCGETDWTKLGCDRKDNTKPHTTENCVPCCQKCNAKKKAMPYEKYLQKIQREAS